MQPAWLGAWSRKVASDGGTNLGNAAEPDESSFSPLLCAFCCLRLCFGRADARSLVGARAPLIAPDLTLSATLRFECHTRFRAWSGRSPPKVVPAPECRDRSPPALPRPGP